MRALAYILLFIIPFTYLLNSIATTAKSPATQTKISKKTDPTPASDLRKQVPLPLLIDIPTQSRSEGKKRTVTVHNKITKKMLTYFKAGANIPKEFSLIINNLELEPGATKQISITDNKIRVRYEYKFHRAFVTRNGSKEVEFELAQNQATFDITFSWEDKWHLIVANAKPLTMTKIY